MLPGFRFLVAAVVLSISLLVFGLGAAALLRTAHEEFASLPVRRTAPQSAFSQQPEAPPTLAMLRLEPHDAKPAVAETPIAPPLDLAPPVAAAPESERAAEPDRLASLSATTPAADATPPVEVSQPEPAKVEVAAPATTVALAPAAPVPPSPAAEKILAPEPAVTASIDAAPAPDQPATTLTDADTKLASTKIAVLGGPPVTIEVPPAPKPVAAPVKKVKKEKERPVKKRRVAERSAPPAVAPATSDAFGWQQPTITATPGR